MYLRSCNACVCVGRSIFAQLDEDTTKWFVKTNRRKKFVNSFRVCVCMSSFVCVCVTVFMCVLCLCLCMCVCLPKRCVCDACLKLFLCDAFACVSL